MADSKITQLAEDTTPLSTDLAISVDDPAGSPVNKKVQLQNLITKAHGLSDGLTQVESGIMTSGNPVDDITISEIDKIVASSANVVDVFLYDTTKDSDKGVWRKRCQHLSWYVQNGEIPALSDIIVDGGAGDLVSMYDITVSTTPLWDSWVVTNPSSVEMLNGQMVVGTDSGALVFNFLENKVYRYNATDLSVADQDIKDFNHSTASWSVVSNDPIVNVTVNDVAIIVLPDSPVSIQTNLPIPTIACLVGETEVLMFDESTKRIDQIKPGDIVKTLEGSNKVVNYFDQGIKDVVEFEFDNGQKLTCTSDHKIRTKDGWIEAGKLSLTDEVVGI